ncbi:hypothetical protein NC652_001009 [Populus alba x Populus x berolinensis]|nr:hypothetical protein NC652_001009 [Populus alba x Populus x berolinensis]
MSIFPFHQLSSNPSPALVMHHQTHRLSVLEKVGDFSFEDRLSSKEESIEELAGEKYPIIVVTDGECILGLGDLGCQVLMLINLFRNWMCIPLLIS